MKNISILDCTLRDGGYVNNWKFGENVIDDILHKLYKTNVDILELGFIRNEEYSPERVVFSSMKQVQKLIEKMGKKNKKTMLAVMAEIAHPIPLEMIGDSKENDIDIVRVIVWKSKHINGKVVDALQDSYEYCKGIVEKGYKLCVQPNRTDQYSDDEFEHMIHMFCDLSPMAIYVVDSWGTMYSGQVIHYMDMADKILPQEISLGFHGHNNMMQAFSTTEKIIERKYQRNIVIDASVYGIGRGAGNLNLELIAKYLNEIYGCSYNIDPMLEIYDRYLKEMRQKNGWGSDMPFVVSAAYGANPNYASYFKAQLSSIQMQEAFRKMTAEDIVLYTNELAHKYQSEVIGK